MSPTARPAAQAAAASMAAAPHPPGAAEHSLHYLALALLFGVMFVTSFIVLGILRSEAHSGAGLVVSIIMAVLPVPLYAFLIVSLDRHAREPLWLLIAAFFWGAVIAVLFAYNLNTGISRAFAASLGRQWASIIGPSLVAPFVEETSKGLALLLLFLFFRYNFNDVVDGIVYGALVGLGFAMTENVLYFVRAHAQGGFVAVSILWFVRAVLGGFGHALYTGCTGAGLGLAEETTSPAVRRIAPFAGYFVAMFLHFLWNTMNRVTGTFPPVSPFVELFVILPFMTVLLSIPGIITLLGITYFGWRRESRVISEQLKEEVDRGVVRPGEYAVLSNDRARAKRVWHTLFTYGPHAWHTVRQFYNVETALAFRKWHRAKGERLPAYLRGQSEDAYRAQIASLRIRLAAMHVPVE